ncbi:MAG: hypothetical protein EAZ62_02695 [Sphingobacteriia bacterium]|nr:MAG: hypothetical protein EAZ62_02695 [Sphingobacteriia bacterium]
MFLYYLLGSIVLTSYLTLSFKVCEKLSIPIFPAIVCNYITCVITGSVVNGAFPINAKVAGLSWFPWAMAMGVLFVSIFNVIGLTAQKNGIAVASVAAKLSLVIPVVLSVFLYQESLSFAKQMGIGIALLAVVLTCWPSRPPKVQKTDNPVKHVPEPKGNNDRAIWVLPVVLFLGSGLLDALINHVQQTMVKPAENNAYLISGFFSAAVIGTTVLVYQMVFQQKKLSAKAVIAGIAIGIPNYFSIWCLVRFLQQSPWPSAASIPVNNMGIVLFSTLVAAIVFKEKLQAINLLGIALATVAIALVAGWF